MSKETRPSTPVRRPVAVLCLALILTLLPLGVLGTVSAAIDSAISWERDPIELLSGGSFHPSVVFDNNNNYHAVFISRSGGNLVYASDISGRRTTDNLAAQMGSDQHPLVAIAVTGTTLHVAFNRAGGDRQVYYIRGRIQGNRVDWSSRVKLSNTEKAGSVAIAADANGTAYVGWVEKGQSCDGYAFAMKRVATDGDVSGQFNTPVRDCGAIQNRPAIAVTSDGVPHVVFSNDDDIYYARLVNDRWTGSQRLAGTITPSITTDGSALYVVYGKASVRFRRSTDGGNTWSNEVRLSSGDARATFGDLTWSETAKRVVIAWADSVEKGGDGEGYDIWTREFVPSTGEFTAADQLTRGDSAVLPSIEDGPRYVGVAYQTRRILLWRGTLSGTATTPTPTPTVTPPVACNGSVVLAGGASVTQNTSVGVAITPSSGCTPSKMQYSVDTPISNAAAIVDYRQSFNVDIAENVSCTPHTVYVRLYANDRGGDVFSSTITVDKSVKASVQVRNPYMMGNTPVELPDGEASGGDATYTRNGRVFLSVTNVGDCAGLKEFNYTGGTPQTVGTNGYSEYIVASGTVQVSVRDNAGNTSSQSFTITDDRDNPTLTSQNAAVTPAVSSTNNIIVNLNFSNIAVDDATYGARENLPQGRRFWGVWMANSRTATAPEAASDKWQAVQVTPNGTFSVPWSLYGGLKQEERGAGQYYVFVRFLDGAGNVSERQIETGAITLAAPVVQPRINLPLTSR